MRRSEARRRRGRALLLLGVLVLHGLLIQALRPVPVAPPAPSAPATVTWLRWVEEPAPAAPPPAAPAPRQARHTAPSPVPSATPQPAAVSDVPAPEPQAITPLPPAPPAAPAPLRLALPPAAPASGPDWRDRVLRDPRANSRPARSATDALQSLAGDGRRREETLAGEGRRRVRIDGACVEVHQARMAQLDPHNQSSNPLPAQVRSCD